VLHQIGVGALGPVFRTYEPERDRLVAVKVFRLDITPEQAQTLADELSRAPEAGLFHPSIVEPIAAGVEGTVAYCAEEYVAAESLDVAMRHYAPAPITTVLPFIAQLAGAIDFARAAGVGHGALHPRDIFVTPEEARATGFGVVEALERVGFRAPVRRPYSPPERIAGADWGTTADVFSLAAITYELLTARRPSGLGREIGTLTAGTPNAFMDSLHAVLARAMDPDPSARYPTALAFASALEASARGDVSDQTLSSGSMAPAAAASAATVISPRAAPIEPDQDDIEAERDEDEADHRLRLREREDVFRQAPGTELPEDIEAEAEADRYAGDDFLLDAAGAAAAAPAEPHDVRARDLPIDARPSDTRVDARAFEDDEVAVEESPSTVYAPRDLVSDETIRRPRSEAATEYRSFSAVPPPVTLEEPPPSRSTLPLAAMFVAGLGLGAIGAYAMWGRGTDPPASRPTSAATSGTAATTPPAGREFSEQAVTPPSAPQATDDRAAAAGRSTAGPAGPGSGLGLPAVAPSAKAGARGSVEPESRSAAAASTGTLVVRSTPSGAGVTLNGRWRGRTPLTLDDLPFRRYDVRVVQPGFAPATEAVVLSAAAPAGSLSVRLQPQSAAREPRPAPPRSAPARPAPQRSATPQTPARDEPLSSAVYTGSIYVDSRPRGARVSIDGKPVGVTPLRVGDVRIGTHVVRLELPDHRLWSTTARVTAGQEQRVTGSLERIQ